jgi:hypothetical protein
MRFKLTRMFKCLILVIASLCFSAAVPVSAQNMFDGGSVSSHSAGGRYSLGNRAIEAVWTVKQNKLAVFL